jgi:collagenase-like PrtC family protease
MELLSPLTTADEVAPLLDAGADAFYCGLITKKWEDTYSTICSSNRRECGEPNFRSFDQIRKAVTTAHDRGARVYMAANAHYYDEDQYPVVLDELRTAVDVGIDALIIADIGLLLLLRDEGLSVDLHVSTGASVINATSAAFFHDLGASRVILDRHLTVEEIRRIVKGSEGMGVEVFILNGRCRNVEGYCTFQHGLHEIMNPVHPLVGKAFMAVKHNDRVVSLAKRLPKRVLEALIDESVSMEWLEPCELRHTVTIEGDVDEEQQDNVQERMKHFVKRKTQMECGACAIHDLATMGLESIKIIGRAFPTSRKLGDVRFIRHLLDYMATEKPSREEFIRHTRAEHKQRFGVDCELGYCYYPSVMEVDA